LAWWGTFVGLWLLLVGEITGSEGLAGMVAAALAATALQVVRARGPARSLPRPRCWLGVPRLSGLVLRDSGRLMVELWRSLSARRPARGVFVTMPLRAEDGEGCAAWRAVLITALSLAPNTYVVGVDADAHTALVHRLVLRSAAPGARRGRAR
jgi:multisubunit Na+/H+ antiporter MnhE subunit